MLTFILQEKDRKLSFKIAEKPTSKAVPRGAHAVIPISNLERRRSIPDFENTARRSNLYVCILHRLHPTKTTVVLIPPNTTTVGTADAAGRIIPSSPQSNQVDSSIYLTKNE